MAAPPPAPWAAPVTWSPEREYQAEPAPPLGGSFIRDALFDPRYCTDCAVATSPRPPERGTWEYFLLTRETWAAANGPLPADMSRAIRTREPHWLCVGCLEQRLKRKLTPADFQSEGWRGFWRLARLLWTDRLRSRVCGTPAFGGVAVAECPPGHRELERLLRDYAAEQAARYGFADDRPPGGEYVPPNRVLVLAYRDGRPVGTGSWRWHDRKARTAEIKRIYIVPAERGHGTGPGLRRWLEQHAAQAGSARTVLEVFSTHATVLAHMAEGGYERIPAYVPGRDPSCLAFAKVLAP